MPTPEEVKNTLDKVLVPDVKRSLIKMNLVRDVSVDDGKVVITIATAALMKTTQEQLQDSVKEHVAKLDGVKDVAVNFVDVKPKELNKIKNVIAVMSGKGGVGILDADITGPSIPKMLGISSRPGMSESGLLPVPTRSGIEVMSINLLLQSDDDAVIWRGPLIGHAITQFWEEVLWGSLDYLIVDLPPGTADAPLTVMQTLPISGIIIVFTPQDLTAMVVRKAVKMARQMGKSILGVVENMSYLHVAEIDKNIELFGKSRGEEMSRAAEAPLLGQLPIDPELAKLGDEGNIEQYNSSMYNSFAQKLIENVPK
jgi:Mrp family chromosome partitioning ATPase